MNEINIFSIYTGSFYKIKEKHFSLLDDGQLPLKNDIKICLKCPKCHARGHKGFTLSSYSFIPCSCVIKSLDKDRFNAKFNIQSERD